MEIYQNFIPFPSWYFRVYFAVVLGSLLFLIFRYRKSLLAITIILLFYQGPFGYLGKNLENLYKIIIMLLTLYFVFKLNAYSARSRSIIFIVWSFFIYSVIFLFSAYYNKNSINLSLSQYAKFLIPFCFFLIFRKISFNHAGLFNKLNKLIITLLVIQVVLSIIKYVIFGNLESIVGSISYIGGAVATLLPLLGFITLWVIRKGKLSRSDWMLIAGLLFLAFVSNKRAIWFMMPVLFFLLIYFVPNRKLPASSLWILPLIPMVFYIGVRLNTTLNKERKQWGSFDLGYVMDYARSYTFGKEREYSESELRQGRGSATFLLFERLSSGLSVNDVLGYGFYEIYTVDYEEFDEAKFGINHKGSATGFFQTYITIGYLGILFFILYAYSIINYIKPRRIRFVFLLLFSWEYFFYTGIIFRIIPLTILFIYSIIYINYLNRLRLASKLIEATKYNTP